MTTEYVKYWNTNTYSGTLQLEGAKTKFVMSKVTREDTSGRYGGQVILYSGNNYDGTTNPYLFTTFKENLTESINAAVNRFWGVRDYSENIELDGAGNRVVYEEATREDTSSYRSEIIPILIDIKSDKENDVYNSGLLRFWDEENYSESLELDETVTKVVYSEKTRES